LVDRLFPPHIAQLVDERLSHEDVLVFGYDREASLSLSDEEIASIELDEDTFRERLSIFRDCQFICFGGSDADWLVALGRMDVVAELARVVRQGGFIPILLCHYATLVVPMAEAVGLDVEGYALPLNRTWSWFDRDECVEIVKSLAKPVVAFMPLASGKLREDVPSALDWLYAEVGVESVLFGTATAAHARETTRLAHEVRQAAGSKVARNLEGKHYAAD
jgi:hypothetical protein